MRVIKNDEEEKKTRVIKPDEDNTEVEKPVEPVALPKRIRDKLPGRPAYPPGTRYGLASRILLVLPTIYANKLMDEITENLKVL